jgi:hypothetical protein
MNEMTRRPATAEEEDMAAEIIIPATELHRLYQERKQEQAHEARRQRRNRLLSGGTIIVLLLVIGALASAITFMLPLEKLVPIVVYQRGDGTVVNTLELELAASRSAGGYDRQCRLELCAAAGKLVGGQRRMGVDGGLRHVVSERARCFPELVPQGKP